MPFRSDRRDLAPVRRTMRECLFTLAERFIVECLLEILGVSLVVYVLAQHVHGILFVYYVLNCFFLGDGPS